MVSITQAKKMRFGGSVRSRSKHKEQPDTGREVERKRMRDDAWAETKVSRKRSAGQVKRVDFRFKPARKQSTESLERLVRIDPYKYGGKPSPRMLAYRQEARNELERRRHE